jgi:hypothetical protein
MTRVAELKRGRVPACVQGSMFEFPLSFASFSHARFRGSRRSRVSRGKEKRIELEGYEQKMKSTNGMQTKRPLFSKLRINNSMILSFYVFF